MGGIVDVHLSRLTWVDKVVSNLFECVNTCLFWGIEDDDS